MTNNPKNINEQLEELKRAYVKGLGAKIKKIGAVRTDLLSGSGLEVLDVLKQLIHKLAGSGGTFGFWEISNAAERAKTACEALLKSPTMGRWWSIEVAISKNCGTPSLACSTVANPLLP
mgnify:CR=1 FL=1